ncbi:MULTISPECIES: GTP-binding protein [Halorubrum]|uniref:Cobalamin biosynthesis protein CobW n=1 Tax=Halorubrum tropicale TaxID=1765655 RepID=A0A0N0BRU9_9EURY|nr:MULTISPECIES: GTP-binding protein [Halorubrum]KOX97374.1 cobalamin biosynthesis protein CobW [Halorubrum tropicale]TKX43917.1 GTP-binding protein [Halorubrum sp. ARQ200]TKX50274.1 GTP-binding protein [Halorubrum sp. ASP121]
MTVDDHPPVTILSGGLGAGKTTLLNHLLTVGGEEYDIAVLVNDVGEVNVDAGLIENGSELSMEDGGVTELSNGCICCGLQNELDQELLRLAFDEEFDYLVIEASGISDPVPIAQRFVSPARASTLYDLDTTVTVVDAAQFHRTFVDGRPIKSTDDGSRPLSDLLAEQVEFCDVLVLNKCDLVTEDERETVERVLETLHPGVDITRTTESAVEPDDVLGTGRFDREQAKRSARWKQVLSSDHGGTGEPESAEMDHRKSHSHDEASERDNGHDGTHDGPGDDHDHRHPPEEFGVDSFVYERHRPFHPERFSEWLRSFPESVVRAKGHLWVAGRERYALDLSQAGTQTHVEVNGRWAVTVPKFQRDSYRESRPDLHWDEQWGDREIKLVFIGAGMDDSAIAAALDDCLLSEPEMAGNWDELENPFPGTMDRSQPPMEQRLVVGEGQ